MDKGEAALSRRNLRLAVGGAAAAGALLVAPFGRSIARRTGNLARGLTATNQSLSLAHGEGARPSELKRARASVAAFEPLGGATPAGDIIHTASHALHGSIPIFLTASRDPRTPARMIAVFN